MYINVKIVKQYNIIVPENCEQTWPTLWCSKLRETIRGHFYRKPFYNAAFYINMT